MNKRVLALLVSSWSAAHAASAAPAPPRLVIEQRGVQQVLVVEVTGSDGAAQRTVLKTGVGRVRPVAAGWDPTGTAAFVTWTEKAPARWGAWSRDGGRTWSEPQAFGTDLKLRDGATEPGQPLPAVSPALQLPPDGRLFLVQFRTIGLPEWRQALADAGATVLSFFPHNAHVVRMDPALVSSLAQLDFVERVAPYHPAYRLEPALRDWALANADDGDAARRVRVVAFEWGAAGKERILEDSRPLGVRLAAWDPSGHILELWVTPDQLRRVAAHDEVMWVDAWTPDSDDMDLVRTDSGANWLETTHGTCGQGVRGEVMDSGVQQNHPDFDGILMHTTADVQSHGTSTFGIVFGNGARDGDGNAQATGHLPSSTGCASQGIFADYGVVTDRFAHTQQLKQAPYFASFQTNSWGGSLTTGYNSVSQQMDDIIWRLDIAITQSQSNNGDRQSRPQAWAKNIISVGGIRHFNTLSTLDDSWTNGASIGPADDGRIKPDISYWYDGIFTTTTGSGYTSGFGGTSAATPESAGVLGLMVQMWSDNVWGTNPTGTTVFERQPHAATIKALMINNTRQYPFVGATHDLTRVHQGWGRPSARVARERAERSFVVDQTTPLQVGQVATYPIEVICRSGSGCGATNGSRNDELRVTLVYPDLPGTTSATLHRINDLSLRVVSPSGVVYHGNDGLLIGNYSKSGGSPNTIDTVENVLVPNAQVGTWTVEVRAAEINADAYPATPAADAVFALVVTGGRRVPAER
ncbi:MAG TPA: S8 family serine peptidase [Vicinamibacteria bacterium]|nr:S8 family serine peptidase [Vicinamibacteria bacterium]